MPDGEHEPGREIALRDELLELLYWLEGEGFAGEATVERMLAFLAFGADEVREALALLQSHGAVETSDGRTYRLTAQGKREAARRFAEEFAPLLRQGHGECNDPTCDCHTNPAGAAECHARQHDHSTTGIQ